MSLTATDPSNFVGYCGLYCNACGIRQGRIKTAVDNLRGIIVHYGFDKMMPDLAKWEPSFQHYEEFTQVMEGLVKMFGECPAAFKAAAILTARSERAQEKRAIEPARNAARLRHVNP